MFAISSANPTTARVVGRAFLAAQQSIPSSGLEVELTILDHRGIETRRTVTRLPAVLGRDPGSDVRLADPSASRTHCALNEINGTLVVRDLGSKHGVFVNGQKVDESHALPGDWLTLGRTRVKVHYRRNLPPTEVASSTAVANEVR